MTWLFKTFTCGNYSIWIWVGGCYKEGKEKKSTEGVYCIEIEAATMENEKRNVFINDKVIWEIGEEEKKKKNIEWIWGGEGNTWRVLSKVKSK